MIVRLVRITFPNGHTMVGLIPAAPSDNDLLTNTEGGIDITFSELAQVPGQAPIAKALEHIRVAAMGLLH